MDCSPRLHSPNARRRLAPCPAPASDRALPNTNPSNNATTTNNTYKQTTLLNHKHTKNTVFRHELYNHKVDQYSFAMIAYQLAEGVAPFWLSDPIEAAKMAAVHGERPKWGEGHGCAGARAPGGKGGGGGGRRRDSRIAVAAGRSSLFRYQPQPPPSPRLHHTHTHTHTHNINNSMPRRVPPKLKALIEACWAADYEARPEFLQVIATLEEILKELPPDPPVGGGGGLGACCALQ